MKMGYLEVMDVLSNVALIYSSSLAQRILAVNSLEDILFIVSLLKVLELYLT